MQPDNKPETHFKRPAPADLVKSKKYSSGRGLTVLVIISGFLLLVAIAVVIMLFMSRAAASNAVQSGDDAKSIKNVSFLPPADLPAVYVPDNQSTNTVSKMFYFDSETNCGLITAITAADSAKSVKDAALAIVNSGNAAGVATANLVDGQKIDLKDSDQQKSYTFGAADLEQSVQVPGVPFNSQNYLVAYKQLGSKLVAAAYGCKSDSWQLKKDELAGLMQNFTLKTEK